MNNQRTSADFNQRVGGNVRRFREAAGLSQTELAEQLTRRGYAFAQQGILKIEQGNRPLKAEELCVFAELLNVPLDALTAQPDERLAALEQLNSTEAAIARCDRFRHTHQQEVERLTAEIADHEEQRQDAAQRLVKILEGQGRPDLAMFYANMPPVEQQLAVWRELHHG
jgi:transcriptional regulator with XRE-family HTH domain